MAKILCATRGGESSYQAQDAAIDLAKERGDELLFLFVVDVNFLNKTERPLRRDTVEREMDNMGEFLLLMALERAKTQGVKSSMLIRHGGFRTELLEVAMDSEIRFLVLGKPSGDESSFSLEELEKFASLVEVETNTKVIIPDDC
jgi:nucleotide-binding universal stress UspA family protein